MPALSQTGRLTVISGAALSLGGLLGGVGSTAVAGAALLSGVALAWVSSVPLPRRMRRERLEFSWWILHHDGSHRRPDEPVLVRITVRNPTSLALTLSSPRLALSPGLRYARPEGERARVPPRSALSFDVEVRATHAGRHVLHGAWMTLSGPLGLSWVPLYFPNPLVLEVGPKAFSLGAAGMRPPRGITRALRAGRAVRRAGEGPELRELRDYQPGDPFRRIAWNATARRGRFVVRETEDESQATRVLVVDASATMRGDDRGRAKIDHVIELTAQAARLAQSTGDALGLVGFDARVVTAVPPGDAVAHLRAVVAAALDLRALVDEDLTDVDEETLVETVARYFREQEGVDALRGVSGFEGRRHLVELIERAVGNDPSMRAPLRAREPFLRMLRAFCRARCIPLPLRHDPSGAAKTQGLGDALRAAVEGARAPRTVLVLSDLDAIDAMTSLRPALGALRQRHHRVSFVAPCGPAFLRGSPQDLSPRDRETHAAVVDLFSADERARLEDARAALGSMGVPLYLATGKEPMAHWLRRAAAPPSRPRVG